MRTIWLSQWAGTLVCGRKLPVCPRPATANRSSPRTWHPALSPSHNPLHAPAYHTPIQKNMKLLLYHFTNSLTKHICQLSESNNSYITTLIINPTHTYVLTESLQQWMSELRIITTPFNNDHWQSIIITLPHALFKKRSALLWNKTTIQNRSIMKELKLRVYRRQWTAPVPNLCLLSLGKYKVNVKFASQIVPPP